MIYLIYGLSQLVGAMRLTTRSEYALLALIALARHDGEETWLGGEEIARQKNIPIKFLQQLLLILKQAHYVRSAKGQHGGYRLAKPASTISLAEIVRLFDGPLAPTESVSKYFYEPTPIEQEDKLVSVFRDIRDLIADKLETTTLADVS